MKSRIHSLKVIQRWAWSFKFLYSFFLVTTHKSSRLTTYDNCNVVRWGWRVDELEKNCHSRNVQHSLEKLSDNWTHLHENIHVDVVTLVLLYPLWTWIRDRMNKILISIIFSLAVTFMAPTTSRLILIEYFSKLFRDYDKVEWVTLRRLTRSSNNNKQIQRPRVTNMKGKFYCNISRLFHSSTKIFFFRKF